MQQLLVLLINLLLVLGISNLQLLQADLMECLSHLLLLQTQRNQSCRLLTKAVSQVRELCSVGKADLKNRVFSLAANLGLGEKCKTQHATEPVLCVLA